MNKVNYTSTTTTKTATTTTTTKRTTITKTISTSIYSVGERAAGVDVQPSQPASQPASQLVYASDKVAIHSIDEMNG
uniref:Uncharacterized protein n=1 Tax=Glossina palpalis gambiensis TaxID=67801 RepID=A0A1B0BLY7_9MUSC